MNIIMTVCRRRDLFKLYLLGLIAGWLLQPCLCVNLTVQPSVTVHITTDSNNDVNTVLIFSPPKIDGLNQGHTQSVYFNYTGQNFVPAQEPLFQVLSADDSIAKVVTVQSSSSALEDVSSFTNISVSMTTSSSNNRHLFLDQNNTQFQYTLVVSGEFMGRTHLKFMIPDSVDSGLSAIKTYTFNSNVTQTTESIYDVRKSSSQGPQNWRELPEVYDVSVIRTETWVDYVFISVITFVVLCANVFMGFKIDLAVVKEVLKKPFAPGIGFVCQFVIMPLVAYGIARALKLEGGQALGFFAAGCAPGGGASNMYTYILGGDVSLSVTMTLVSTLASFAMTPLWLYTLGQHLIHNKYNISIPFSNIFLSLLGIIIPVGIGILIQRKKPNLVVKLVKYLKPVFIVLIIFLFIFGAWINWDLLRLFTPNILLAGCLLPYIGFILSGLAATACRQPFNRIVTIIIETGIQNTGIPIILMRFSLPQPEAELSMISPVIVAMFTPFPLWIAFVVKEFYQRCWKKKKENSVQGGFDFQRVHTDSDISPEDEDTALDLDSMVTFDTSCSNGGENGGINNSSKEGHNTTELVT